MLIALDKNRNRISINNTSSKEKYYCPLCNEEFIQKKGSIRCHHFAHKSGGLCTESKYYDTSQWHLNWQNKFPVNCQEVIKTDEFGKKHIADILIYNRVIEFQHSNLPFEEFNDRNEFYSKLGYHVIWVFDGNDIFNSGYQGGQLFFRKPLKCLKELQNIPPYLDIFIEGTINYNLLEEEGTFLYHIDNIDAKKGIIFNGKLSIDEFYQSIIKDVEFNFKKSINSENKAEKNSSFNKSVAMGNLVSLFEMKPNTNKIIAYNPSTGYDVLLDRENYLRLKKRKQAYGKIRKHMNKGRFLGDKVEIYYANDKNWILQWELSNADNDNKSIKNK